MSQSSLPRTADRWLTSAELADRVGTSARTIQRLANANRIAHHRLPGTNLIRFSPEDVDAFESEARKVPA